MAKPLDGKPPVDGSGYWRAPFGWHLAGLFGGAVWCVGAVANFVASVAHLAKPIGRPSPTPSARSHHDLRLLGHFRLA